VSLILPLISGIALALSFPPMSIFVLAWVGLIPYLHFLTQRPGWGKTILGHLLLALPYFGGILYWIPRVVVTYGGFGWPAALGIFALLLLVLAVFLFPFTFLTRLVAARSESQALACAAGFWLLTELVRNYYAVNGFPWGLLGYSQYPYHWVIQIADIGGVYLISFLVVLVNASLVALFRFKAFRFVALSATFLVAANLYGIYRAYFWRPHKVNALQAAVVQPNIGLAGDREHYAGKYFEELPAAYKKAVNAGADWVIFPEAQNPYFFSEDFYYRNFFTRLVASFRAPLLFNSTSVESDNRYYNSAIMLGSEGQVDYRYDKMHLVPFGEYVPAAEWLGFIDPLTFEVSAFTPGREYRLGQVGNMRFATLICFEGIFPEIGREFQKRGAEIFVIITNDAWYGRTAAPEQHLQIGAFRAIENRRMVLRAANSGYSAIIDPLGRFRRRTELFESDLIIADAFGYRVRTAYSYLGEWLNIVLIATTVPLAMRRGAKGSRRGGRRKRRCT